MADRIDDLDPMPPKASTKQPVTLRLDPDVLANFRATGPGWRSRMNEVLRDAAI